MKHVLIVCFCLHFCRIIRDIIQNHLLQVRPCYQVFLTALATLASICVCVCVFIYLFMYVCMLNNIFY